MNKRYIDFVPTSRDSKSKASATRSTAGGKVGTGAQQRASAGVRSRSTAGTVARSRSGAAVTRSRVGTTGRVASAGRVVSTGRVASAGRAASTGRTSVRRDAPRSVSRGGRVSRQPGVYTELPAYQVESTSVDAEMSSFSLNDGSGEFGVIEDLPSRFVNTAVEKRPLSGGSAGVQGSAYGVSYAAMEYDTGEMEVENVAGAGAISSGDMAKEAKSKKVGRKASRAEKKLAKKAAKTSKASAGKAGAKAAAGGAAGAAVAATAGKAGSKAGAKATYGVPKSPFINQGSVAKRPLSKNVYHKKVQPTKEENQGPVAIISKPEKDSKAGVVVGIILTIILGAAAGTIAFLLLPK